MPPLLLVEFVVFKLLLFPLMVAVGEFITPTEVVLYVRGLVLLVCELFVELLT